MSGLHLIAIVDAWPAAATVPPGCVVQEAAGLAAVQGLTASPGSREDRARLHHRRVAACLAARAVLPVALGTDFSDARECADWLAGRVEALRDGLSQVRDKVELSLRLQAPATASPATSSPRQETSGRAFLARKQTDLAVRWGQQALAQDVLNQSLPRTIRRHLIQPQRGPTLIDAALLLDRDAVSPTADALSAALSAAGLEPHRITGPWAPWSFVPAPLKPQQEATQ